MSASLQELSALPVSALAWLGRQGTRAIASLVFIGLAIPPLGMVLKPYVTEAVFILLCVSFMRVDVAAMRGYLRRPVLVVAATLWGTVITPLVFGFAGVIGGLDRSMPDLFLGLMLQMVAPPMMASPALVALMGLDSTLVLVTLVTSTMLVPFTAPLFAHAFCGHALTLSPLALGAKLFAVLMGAILVAVVIRRSVGVQTIVRHRLPIDGFNILILLVFVSAVMGSVAESFWANPLHVLLLTVLAFAVFAILLGITVLVFRVAGREEALALGLMASQRNLGLMLAATGGALPAMTWLYFALAQFPIYLSPQLLKPLMGRLRTKPAGSPSMPVTTP